jgi:hypothetical protein
MVFAMLSIGLLGFLVWAQDGLPIVWTIDNLIWLYAGIALLFKLLWIYYNSIVKIFKFSQSAGNCKGSSETLRQKFYTPARRAAGGFKRYLSYEGVKNLNFIIWFIGFTEGDGSFIISRPKIGKPKLFFIINQKEYKVLEYIKKNLGFGKIHKYNNYYRFIVADYKNIDKLINIFNGQLRLNKTNLRFNLWLNIRNEYSNDQILLLNPKFSSLNDNAWLSGFIDAEGCFNFNAITKSTIKVRFLIDQKDEFNILNKIQNHLKAGSINIRKNNQIESEIIYRYSLYNQKSLKLLNDYLIKFPLKSHKSISLIRFNKLINYANDESLKPWSDKVILRIKNLGKNINKFNPDESDLI